HEGNPRMAHREPLQEQEPTIGKLVVDAFDDLGTLVRHMIELAKSELRVSVRAGGMAIALFLLAGFLGLLSIIMVSIAIAFFIHMAGLDLAWCFLIVFGAYVLLAALLGLIGYRKIRKVRAPERTIAEMQEMRALKPGA
ncbi:MAG TPA: phage holin family protein, partial [Marmoricola sp.]|nr:phage holin family protein [Marmoricola sp.]